MHKLAIRTGDTVEVTSGADKGKKGAVLEINNKALKIKVQGVSVNTKHDKQNGLQKLESYIDYSNVKFVSKAATPKKAKKK